MVKKVPTLKGVTAELQRKIKFITIQRGEGDSRTDDFSMHKFTSLRSADSQLHKMSMTAPGNGGYHKTDVILHLKNSRAVKARIDLKRGADNSIEGHFYHLKKFNYDHPEYAKMFEKPKKVKK